jgi:hypothetical protein
MPVTFANKPTSPKAHGTDEIQLGRLSLPPLQRSVDCPSSDHPMRKCGIRIDKHERSRVRDCQALHQCNLCGLTQLKQGARAVQHSAPPTSSGRMSAREGAARVLPRTYALGLG